MKIVIVYLFIILNRKGEGLVNCITKAIPFNTLVKAAKSEIDSSIPSRKACSNSGARFAVLLLFVSFETQNR